LRYKKKGQKKVDLLDAYYKLEWAKRKKGVTPVPLFLRGTVLKKRCPVKLIEYLEKAFVFEKLFEK